MTDTTQAPIWTSRIIGHGEEAPDQLLAHPGNWRIHSQRQQAALSDVLNRVGWIKSVIVNQRTQHVVDGHLRVALAISRGESSIPVEYVDLSEEEERLVLATVDPLAGMAGTDTAQLMSLIAEIDAGEELSNLLSGLAGVDAGIKALVSQEQVDASDAAMLGRFLADGAQAQASIFNVTCPGCGYEFGVSADSKPEV